jgi:hypothetical protein
MEVVDREAVVLVVVDLREIKEPLRKSGHGFINPCPDTWIRTAHI